MPGNSWTCIGKMTTSPHRDVISRAFQMTTRLHGNDIITESLQLQEVRWTSCGPFVYLACTCCVPGGGTVQVSTLI
jgi:hypothetical protein